VPCGERPADWRHSIRSVRSLQSALRPQYCGTRAGFVYFGAKDEVVSLQFRLAGGEGGIRTLSTTLVGSPLLRTQESQVEFAKSSVCDRQQFANQVCKLGPLLGSWRKRAIECLVVTQQPFSPLGFSEKLSQNTGYFLCFVGDSVKFLCSRD